MKDDDTTTIEEPKKQEIVAQKFHVPTSTDSVKPFIPADFPSVFRFSELIAASGMAPNGVNRPEQIATAIFMGGEIGMTPMAALRWIAVINNRPSVWGDGALGIIRASGLLEDIHEYFGDGDFGDDDYTAYCVLKRKGVERPVTGEFSIADAKKAQLWTKTGPWQQYPKRMLKMRARAFALRDLFTDKLGGFSIGEEVQDEMIDVTPRGGGDNNAPPDPGEAGGDGQPVPAKRRGRPPGSRSANKYQTQREATDVTDVEVEKAADARPAEAATAAPEAKQKQDAAKAEPKKDAPAPVGAVGLAGIIDEYGAFPDDIKKLLTERHEACLKAVEIGAEGTRSETALRVLWNRHFPKNSPPWPAKYDEHVKRLKEWHTNRVTALEKAAKEAPAQAAEDDGFGPPDPGAAAGSNDLAKAFDYDGFKAMLVAELGKAKNADDVSRFFDELTEMPERDGILNNNQMDELREIASEALGKFGA